MGEEFKIEESTLTVPKHDRRLQLVGELQALCEEIVKVTHALNRETNERMIGRLEERWFTLRRAIVDKQADAYLNEGIYVDVASTDKLLPIRVREVNKMSPWGRPCV